MGTNVVESQGNTFNNYLFVVKKYFQVKKIEPVTHLFQHLFLFGCINNKLEKVVPTQIILFYNWQGINSWFFIDVSLLMTGSVKLNV